MCTHQHIIPTILLQFVLTTILSSSYLSKLCSSSLSKLVLQLLSLCAFRYSSTKILLSYAHFKPRPDFTSFLFSSILLNFSPLQQCYDLTLHVYIWKNDRNFVVVIWSILGVSIPTNLSFVWQVMPPEGLQAQDKIGNILRIFGRRGTISFQLSQVLAQGCYFSLMFYLIILKRGKKLPFSFA